MVKQEYMLKDLFFIIIIVAIDQFSKLWVVHKLLVHQTLQLLDVKWFGLNLFLTYNTGIAFGFFHQANGWQNGLFLSISIIAVGAIAYLFINNKINDYLEKLALLLILGGAIGNLVDRIIYGHVIDFIDIYAVIKHKYLHWYTFNIADSAICIGVALLIFKDLAIKIFAKTKSISNL